MGELYDLYEEKIKVDNLQSNISREILCPDHEDFIDTLTIGSGVLNRSDDWNYKHHAMLKQVVEEIRREGIKQI